GNRNLIIFDDVADSFDYKNKYAIIEYIKDLHLSNGFKMIILTHNFDFYRTVSSRLFLDRGVVYMATKNACKEIKLHQGRYVKEIFPYFLRNYKNRSVFISLIAFVRNIVDYTDSKDCDDYKTLASLLHLMEATATLQVKHIHDIYVRSLVKLNGKAIDFGEESVVDFILNTANDICAEQNIDEVMLENIISLAIAIRLKAEEYLISKL